MFPLRTSVKNIPVQCLSADFFTFVALRIDLTPYLRTMKSSGIQVFLGRSVRRQLHRALTAGENALAMAIIYGTWSVVLFNT